MGIKNKNEKSAYDRPDWNGQFSLSGLTYFKNTDWDILGLIRWRSSHG